MGNLINVPTLDVPFLRFNKMAFDIVGSAIDGGRDGAGPSISIETSGGGHVIAAYRDGFGQRPESHEYINWLGARLNGSFRYINVPLMTGWAGPFPLSLRGIPQPIIKGVPHSDGSLFSDGTGYSQATVFGTFEGDGGLNAGRIALNIFGNVRPLRWSDWFSTFHETKGWRAYRYWESTPPSAVTRIVDGVPCTGEQYILSISPPLREAVKSGQKIEFAWPRFVAKFPVGFTLPWEAEGHHVASPSLEFTEAF